MTDPQTGMRVLVLTGGILGAFGLVVAAVAAVARLTGRDPAGIVKRYLAWGLILPPVLLPLIVSRTLFQIVVALLSLQCLREFARATGLWTDRWMTALAYGLTAAMYVPIFAGRPELHQAAPLAAVGVLVLAPIVRGRYEHMLQKVSLTALGVLYFGWFLSHLALLRDFEEGIAYVFYLMVLVECNDAFGYLWGRCLGRRKLAPRISPNKTVEGAVGGIVSVVGVAVVLRHLLPAVGGAAMVLLGGLVAVLGLCGDLVVSVIKRDLRVKDMGAAIPGHGGVLDRCDSMILAAPVVFHVMRYAHAL